MLNWLKNLFASNKPTNNASVSTEDADGYVAFHEGNIKFLSGDDYNALPFYDKAITHGITEAYSQRAYCLQSLGYFLDALEDFEHAIMAEPDDCNLRFSQSMAFLTVGNYSAAVSSIGKAVELSKVKSSLNITHDISARKQGYNSITDMMLTEQRGIEVIANMRFHKPVSPEKLVRRP